MDLHDGLRQALLGLGTAADRQATTAYVTQTVRDQDWSAVYAASSVGQKIVDIPALDATREWRNWQATEAIAGKIKAIEARLALKAKVLAALKSARLYGGAGLYAADGHDPAAPLTRPIQGLRVLPAAALTPSSEHVADLADPCYGQPLWFAMRGEGNATSLQLHPSRLAIFQGVQPPVGAAKPTFWGRSVLGPVLGPLKALDTALHNAAALFHKAVVDTVRIPGLSGELKREGGEAAVRARLETLKLGMSVHNLAALDGDEVLERPAITFVGQDKMMREFAQLVAAAADIPATRLFGRSPAGLSATGESDMRNYYDRVRALQETEISPALMVFDRLIWAEATGVPAQDTALPIVWNPLWQETLASKAKTASDLTHALGQSVETGVLDLKAARAALLPALHDLGLQVST